jgi:hypothetical protein
MGNCGNTEQMASRAEAQARLQTNTPRYWIRSTPPGLTTADVAAAIEEGCRRWTNAGVNVTMVRVTDVAEIGPDTVVDVIEAAALKVGVLADQTLGNGVTKQHRMRVSTQVDWHRTSLATVMAHELGHLWGLEHFPNGDPEELMEAVLGRITHPQPTEAAVARAHFARFPPIEPEPTPTPTPTPDPCPPNCCFRLRQSKQALYARIPMDLSADQQAKVAEAKKAIAALDCQTIFKALIQEALSKLAGALCPQSKEAPNA